MRVGRVAGAPLGREYSLTVRAEPRRYQRLLAARAAAMLARARARTRRRRRAPRADPPRAVCRHALPRAIVRNRNGARRRASSPNFHAAHRRTFGLRRAGRRGRSREYPPARHRAGAVAASDRTNRARVNGAAVADAPNPGRIWRTRARAVPIYARDALGAGARIRGPAIVVELSSTAYVAPEFTLRADDFGNLHLEASAR